jgi:hypothetical protein
MSQDQNLRSGQVCIRKERIRMRNVILKNITDKADSIANQYNKTKDPGLRDQWYELLRQVSEHQEPVSPSARRLSRK